MDPDARKGRVVDVALDRLHTCGFTLSTLDDVARAADLGEGELQAVFGDVEGLMQELVAPLLGRLRAIASSAAAADLHRPEQLRAVIEAYLDALVANRPLVGVVLGDPAGAASRSISLVREAMGDICDQLASGTGVALEHRIRATSALGAVHAAVLEATDFEPTTVRAVITDAAVAILLS